MNKVKIFSIGIIAIFLAMLIYEQSETERQPRMIQGYHCSCEQREQVGHYVAQLIPSELGSSSPQQLINRLFATGVTTLCDHKDSVRVDDAGRMIGMLPCELFFQDFIPITP